MIITDEYGKWEVNGNVRFLLEPSQKWIEENNRPKTIEEQKQDILYELAELDMIVSRDREATWEAGVQIYMTDVQLQAIEQKKALREQLRGLDNDVANS